ncbi:hypothetical protein OXX79_003057 [Metschnikowia pulcherrima]
MANVKEAAPDSEEHKFKIKCQELRKRIAEVEESNEISTIALSRTRTSIRRLRLEYAVLLERLEAQVVNVSEDPDAPHAEAMPRPQMPLLTDTNLDFQPVKPAKGKPRKGRNGQMSAAALRRAARDPNLPKRPTNAYLMFCEREKDRVKADLERENPGKPATELTRVLTDLWKALDDTAKIPYLKLYEEDRERYHREMVVYNKRKHEDMLNKNKPAQAKLGVTHLEAEDAETATETGDLDENLDGDEDDLEDEAEDEDDDANQSFGPLMGKGSGLPGNGAEGEVKRQKTG